MEITAKPRRRRGWRAVRAMIGVGTLLVVVLLIPPALGFRAHVVHDDAMTGTHARGSLVLDERVSRRQIAVGDVITFVPPGAGPAAATVTRRVVAIDRTSLWTRGDAAAADDPWQLSRSADDLAQVAFSLPYVGYPVLALQWLALPPWAPAVLVLGLAAVLVQLRRSARTTDDPEPLAPEVVVRAPAGATARPPLT